MKPEVWSLDDERINGRTVQSILEEDGWIWRQENALYGVDFRYFERKRDIIAAAEAIIDFSKVPALVLLDANLGGNPPDRFGGFDVWRALMDHFSTLPNSKTAVWPKLVIYTRDTTVLELANALQHPRANPQIIPFAASKGKRRFSGDEARSAVSEPLAAVMSELALAGITLLNRAERISLADAIEGTLVAANLESIMVGDYGPRIHQVFPRECRNMFDSKPHVRDHAKAQLKMRVLCQRVGFRDALSEALRYFRDDKIDISNPVDQATWDAFPCFPQFPTDQTAKNGIGNNRSFRYWVKCVHSSGKITHWLDAVSDRPGGFHSLSEDERRLAIGLCWEAQLRWNDTLADSRIHPRFADSGFWQAIRKCADSSIASDGLPDALGKLRNELKRYYRDESHGLTACFKQIVNSEGKAFTMDTKALYFQLGVSVDDLEVVRKCIFGDDEQACVQNTVVLYGRSLFCGLPQQGFHFLFNQGINSSWNASKAQGSMQGDPSTESLSELADLICRVYQGQLLVGCVDVNGTSIKELLVRYPNSWACRCAAPEIRQGIWSNYQRYLMTWPGRVFNIVSLRT